jgi:hypothetical protein
MRFQAVFTVFLIICNIHPFTAQEKINFQLQKTQKALKIVSGDIDQTYSAHFIIFKDHKRRKYGIKPFFITDQNKVKSLKTIEFESRPNIESYHYSEKTNTLTLITEFDKKHLNISDFYVDSNTYDTYTTDFENSYITARLPDKSILITISKREKKLNVKTIYSSYDLYDIEYDFNEIFEGEFDIIFSNKPEFVNQNEFVKNGSINFSKLYIIYDQLIFDHTSKSKYISLQINPDVNKTPIVVETELNDPNTIKDIDSYVFEDKFFLFINRNKDITIKTYDNLTTQQLDEISISKSLGDVIPFTDLQNYIKTTKKNRFNITGTVNSTVKRNRILVTLDYVDKNKYKYNHDWWFHHWMMNQQMKMMNTSNSFGGPHPAKMDFIFPAFETAEKNKPVQFELDRDFKIYPKVENTNYKDVPKDYYIKKMNRRKDITQLSVAFTRSSIRYLFYSDKTKSFHIETDKYIF